MSNNFTTLSIKTETKSLLEATVTKKQTWDEVILDLLKLKEAAKN